MSRDICELCPELRHLAAHSPTQTIRGLRHRDEGLVTVRGLIGHRLVTRVSGRICAGHRRGCPLGDFTTEPASRCEDVSLVIEIDE
jgi:hypothetical protein